MSLHEAASVGDVASIRALLQYGFSPDATDADGDTPLHLAAAGGHVQAIQCLLGAGASMGVRNQHGASGGRRPVLPGARCVKTAWPSPHGS